MCSAHLATCGLTYEVGDPAFVARDISNHLPHISNAVDVEIKVFPVSAVSPLCLLEASFQSCSGSMYAFSRLMLS